MEKLKRRVQIQQLHFFHLLRYIDLRSGSQTAFWLDQAVFVESCRTGVFYNYNMVSKKEYQTELFVNTSQGIFIERWGVYS